MNKPLCIDLFCGLGGWADGFLAEGYNVIGFDIERHDYGTGEYPGQLVLQDVLTLHGSQFKDAAVIVASPPCQFFSYTAMPWTRAKRLAEEVRSDPVRLEKELALFRACFRIQREANDANRRCRCDECNYYFDCGLPSHHNRHIPLIVENVCGTQPWVGPAKWHYGSFYLWGDVPALMPYAFARMKFPADCGPRMWSEREYVRLNDGNASAFHHEGATKNSGGSWFNVAHNTTSGKGQNPDGRKTVGHVNQRDGHTHTRHLTNQRESDAVKQHGSGPIWFDTGIAKYSSKSDSRKAASAMIAKIPFPLARHIARCFKPHVEDFLLMEVSS